MTGGRSTTPANTEAEQAVIGALLLQNGLADRLAGWLLAQHFSLPVHGQIYSDALSLIQQGRDASPVSLKPRYDASDVLADVGGSRYLARLAGAGAPASAVHLARELVDLARRRAIVDAALAAAEAAQDDGPDVNADAVLDQAEAALFALRDTDHRGGPVSLDLAIGDSIEAAKRAAEAPDGLLGTTTGVAALDEMTGGLQPGTMTIAGGRPAMGKTSLASHIAVAAAKSGKGVLFFSLEMSREQLAIRIACALASRPDEPIRYFDAQAGRLSSTEQARLTEAQRLARHLPLMIDDRASLPLAAIRATARRQAREFEQQGRRLELVVLDHLSLVGEKPDRTGSEVLRVGRISSGLKALAKDLNCAVLVPTQLNRGLEGRNDKRPSLADLRDSGAIEQDADLVMFVFREEYYAGRETHDDDPVKEEARLRRLNACAGKAEIIIGKQRQGPTGTVHCGCDIATGVFRDLEVWGR